MAFFKDSATVSHIWAARGSAPHEGQTVYKDSFPERNVRTRQPRPRRASNFQGSEKPPRNGEILYYLDATQSLSALQERVAASTKSVNDLSAKLEAAQTIAAFTSQWWKTNCAGKTGNAWQLCNNLPSLMSNPDLVNKAKLIGLNPGSGNTASEDFANSQVPVLQGQLNTARTDLATATAQLNAAMGTAAQSDPGAIAAKSAADQAVIKAQSTASMTKYFVLGGGVLLFAGVLFLIFRK